MHRKVPPKEGDLFKTIEIDGHIFELRFGYYEEFERESGEPVLIYPDLETSKLYTKDGNRIVTAIQDPCEYYHVSEGVERDECCNDCKQYHACGREVGICTHPSMKKSMIKIEKEGGKSYD